MEFGDQTTQDVYLQLLGDTLKKKVRVLDKLLEFTKQQEGILSADTFDEEAFQKTITLKDEQIQMLSQLDNGFEQLYERVKEELLINKGKFSSEINDMKKSIACITNLSVELQALEKRNQEKLKNLLATKRMGIKKSRLSSQTAANYYKTMAKQNEAQSYFYDKKK